MRKMILLAATLAWPLGAYAQSNTTPPDEPGTPSAVTTNPPAAQPVTPKTPPATTSTLPKTKAKTKTKTSTKTTAPGAEPTTSSSAAVNPDPCNPGSAKTVTAQATPDATASNSNDASIQCKQDKAKPMQGGLVGH